MKTFFKIVVVFLLTQSALSQVLPLSSYSNIPAGAHLKDLNGDLVPYTGTWEGTLNNKKYTFVFVKFPDHFHDLSNFFNDDLMGNFKVTDLATNQVIYDNTMAVNYDDFRIFGTTPNTNHGRCKFFFTDTEANCKNTLSFILSIVPNQPTQLLYSNFDYEDGCTIDIGGCTNFTNRMDIPVYLPKQNLILTKI